MNMTIIEDLYNSVKAIIGTKCWRATNEVAGTLLLNFGDVLLKKLTDPDELIYVGQFDILVWCTWRLDHEDDSLCSSACSGEKIARMIYPLMGDSVVDVKVFSPVWDLSVYFSSGRILKVFSAVEDPTLGSWDFRNMEAEFYVGQGNSIEKGKRKGLLPNVAFDPSIIEIPSIDEMIDKVNNQMPYEEMLSIAKKIKENDDREGPEVIKVAADLFGGNK